MTGDTEKEECDTVDQNKDPDTLLPQKKASLGSLTIQEATISKAKYGVPYELCSTWEVRRDSNEVKLNQFRPI